MEINIRLDTPNPSQSFLKCIDFSLPDKFNLLEEVLNVCSECNKKKIFVWENLENATEYMEKTRLKCRMVWLVLLCKIIEKTENKEDTKIKLYMGNDYIDDFRTALKICHKI